MKFYFTVTAVLAVAVLVLIVAFGATVQTLVSSLLVALPLATLVMRRTPKLYLPLKRLLFQVQNTPATWDVTVRFTCMEPVDVHAMAEGLIAWSEGDSKLISSAGGRHVVRVLRRFVVELHSDEGGVGTALGEDDYHFHLTISPFTIGYRSSKHLIEGELIPLLEFVRSRLTPERVTYALRVELPGENPFFGLYLEQMKLHHVQDFRIEIRIPTRSEASRVTVARDRMTIVADTIENFRAAATTALAFELPRG